MRYSTALSGLLNAARIARCTSALSNPMSTSCKVKPPRMSRPVALHCTQYWQVIAEVCPSRDCLYCAARHLMLVQQQAEQCGQPNHIYWVSNAFSNSIPITLHPLLITCMRYLRYALQ